MLILAYDGDNAGRLVGRAILGNDLKALSDVSSRIELGHEIVQDWVTTHGGTVISGGGDEGCFQVPESALEDIERLRQDYAFATNLTMTVGIGQSLSEAGKSLLVGKFRGKNMVVRYDQAVEAEIDQAQKHVEEHTATREEEKLTDAYLKPQDGDVVPPEEDALSAPEATGMNPPQLAKPDPSKEAPLGLGVTSVDPTSYNNTKLDQNTKESVREQQNTPAEAGTENKANVHSEQGMKEIAEAIMAEENQDNDLMDNIDAEDLAVGTESVAGTSRPEDYTEHNVPNDMGLAEDAPEAQPDVSEVLKEGLDTHASNMQREKVIDMIGQALAGFKAQKHILERAATRAPELYGSCLAMLKAMIEMSKMLGLGQQQEQQNPLEDAAAQEMAPEEAEIVDQNEVDAPTEHDDCPYCKPAEHDCPYCNRDDAQAEAPAEESLHDCPYCAEGEEHEKHKDKPKPEAKGKPEAKPAAAAPQEGAALPPKKMG